MKPTKKTSTLTACTSTTSPSVPAQQHDYSMKMIIIGDSGVGKSSLLFRYTQDKFVDNYIMTIGLNYIWKIEQVDGLKIKLQIWDTAGQEKYKTITQNYYKNCDGAIISYSIDSRDSFSSVRTWIGQLTETVKQSTQIILVGTKCDLIEQRQIQRAEAQQFAKQNNLQYMECSAKSGQSVNQVFYKLTTMMKEHLIDAKLKQPDDKVEESNKGKGVIKLIKNRAQNLHSKCCASGN